MNICANTDNVSDVHCKFECLGARLMYGVHTLGVQLCGISASACGILSLFLGTCSFLLLNLWCQYIIFKHLGIMKRPWKIFHAGPKESRKNPGFFVNKSVGTLQKRNIVSAISPCTH